MESTEIPEPKWLFYVLSFIVPAAGIVIGIIYYIRPEEEHKKFGKTCLISAAIPIALIILYVLVVVVFYVLVILMFFVFYFVLFIIILLAALAGGVSSVASATAGGLTILLQASIL